MAERRYRRARRPDHPVLDVAYADLVRTPVDTVAGIYGALGLDAGAGAFDAMTALVAERPRGRFGSHAYDVARFGLDERELRERFAGYTATYDVESESLG